MNRRTRTLVSALAASAIGVVAAGCGSDSSSSDTSTATTGAVSAETASPTSDDDTASPSGSADDDNSGADTFGGLPVYEPSNQVSKAPGSLVLTSPDSVEKVGQFYTDAVEDGGWDIVSETVSRFAASITVTKDGSGASISVAPGPEGSVISISSYPSP